MPENPRKVELTAELARARSRISQEFGGLRRDMNFSGRISKAIRKSPTVWAGGAAILGVVFSLVTGRRKKVVIGRKGSDDKVAAAGKAGVLLAVLKITFDLFRPVLAKWAGRRVSDYMDSRGNVRRVSR